MKKMLSLLLMGALAGCANPLSGDPTPKSLGPAADVIIHSADIPELDFREEEILHMGNAGVHEATSYEPQECAGIGWDDSETRAWGRADGDEMASTGFNTPDGVILVMVDKKPVEVGDCPYVVTMGETAGTPNSHAYKVTQLEGGGTLQKRLGGSFEYQQIVQIGNEGGYHFVVVDPRGQQPDLVQQVAQAQREKLAS
ncbi:hypothetical protein [Corynebacterium gerontici]|uniref:DUF5642 domain-containing protein n=1 Tax=Corynebacterium gerontici TaxID=2079234 RepID=A0A3G6IXJ5_9CORY|nr:hypothetical protein [Corynebacterium gerontici]AZA10366.1 hypothetical protein CGERO_00135 [Corynebacterium gerontici]